MSDATVPAPDTRVRGGARALLPLLRPLQTMAIAIGVVSLVAGALPWLTGQDPAYTVLRARFGERPIDDASLAAVRAELDLPGNPLAGALTWLGGAVRGDLGVSWVDGDPVAGSVGPALLVSLNLALVSAGMALLLAILVVTPALLRVGRGRRVATPALTAGAALLAAVPGFVLAVLLVAVLAVRLHALPATGWRTPMHMILPCLALAVPTSGVLARVMATSIVSTADEAWVRTWRANGGRPARISVAVAHRALAVVLPLVLLVVAGTIGAAVLIEDVFAIPGLGRLALSASLTQDLPMVQGAVAALVLTGVTIGALGAGLHALLLAPTLGAGRGSTLTRVRPLPRTHAQRLAPVVILGVLGVIIVGGLLRDGSIDASRAFLPPGLSAPLGTDSLGRDVWARLGHGALLTVGLAVACSVVSLVLGLLIGLASRSGRAGVADVLNAVPATFMGIIVASVIGPGLFGAALAVCIAGWIPLAVHARTLAAEVRATGFHQAAVVAGAGPWWLLRRHLVPLVLPPLTQHALVRLPRLALALTGLSFLGVGAPHDSPEWGKMLADSVSHLERAPWTMAGPAVALVLVGLVASLLGSRD